MKRINICFTVALSIIMIVFGMCWSDIGTKSEQITYTWSLPLTALFVLGVMFCLGYVARIEDEEED